MVPFVLPIKTALGHYIYDANNNEVICVRPELYHYVDSLLSGKEPNYLDEQTVCDYNSLRDCGYLLHSKVQTIAHPLTEVAPYRLERSIGNLILQITRNCNLRCRYCVYSEDSNLMQRHHSSEVMTFDVAKQALLFYRNHIIDSDSAVIGFYGGEPLLEFSLIRKIVDYCESLFRGKEVLYSITTNATLLDEEIINYLSSKNFHIVFSIDGPEHIHDKNRIFSNGKGSFRTAINNIERYVEMKAGKPGDAAINTVIDPHLQYGQMADLLDTPFLKDMEVTASPIEQDGVLMPISPAFSKEFDYQMFLSIINYYRASTPEYHNGFLKKEIASINQDIKKIKENRMASVAAPGGPCIPGKPRLFVDCYGNMYPCEKVNENETMKIGSIYEGFDYSKIRNLMNIGQLTPEKCKRCWAFSLCSVCAKHADSGESLSADLKCQHCEQSKNTAYAIILNKILAYENSVHNREMCS